MRQTPRQTARGEAAGGLRHAILFGTLINIVAFLPLALLPGDKGAYGRTFFTAPHAEFLQERVEGVLADDTSFAPSIAASKAAWTPGLSYGT